MNETNLIVEAVAEAQSSLSQVNMTLIWITIIQLVGTVLIAWTTILSRIILKDVNSDRTARIAEVQNLNDQLTDSKVDNTRLKEQANPSQPNRG